MEYIYRLTIHGCTKYLKGVQVEQSNGAMDNGDVFQISKTKERALDKGQM